MKKWITEYGHLALMCACLACSAVLLGSVLLDRPLVQAALKNLVDSGKYPAKLF